MLLLLCFILYLRAISKCKPPGAYVLRGQVMEGLLCYEFEELIHGGALIIVILQHGNINYVSLLSMMNFCACIRMHS